MFRLTFFAVILIANVAHADPIPKSSDDSKEIKRVFGDWIDPDKDCHVTKSGSGVKITIPEDKPHLYEVFASLKNAPRLEREVEGNFTLTVQVTFRFDLDPKAMKVRGARINANCYAVIDDRNYAMNCITWRETNNDPFGLFFQPKTMIDNELTSQISTPQPFPKNKSFWLRYVRIDDTISGTTSPDGLKWNKMTTMRFPDHAKIKVGLMAEAEYKKPVEVIFDQYQLNSVSKNEKDQTP